MNHFVVEFYIKVKKLSFLLIEFLDFIKFDMVGLYIFVIKIILSDRGLTLQNMFTVGITQQHFNSMKVK